MAHPPSRPEIFLDITLSPDPHDDIHDVHYLIDDEPNGEDVRNSIHTIYEEHPWIQGRVPSAVVSHIAYSGTEDPISGNKIYEIELTFSSGLLIKDKDRAAFDAMGKRIARELAARYKNSRVVVTVSYATVIEEVFTNPVS